MATENIILHTFLADDRERILFLEGLACRIFHQMRVSYTRPYLRTEMIRCYFATFGQEPAYAGGQVSVVDKDEAGNLAFILLACLKHYGIDYTLHHEIPAIAEGTVVMLLESEQSMHYSDLLVLWGHAAGHNKMEYAITLHAEADAAEPGYHQHVRARTMNVLVQLLAAVFAVVFIGGSIFNGFANYAPGHWIPPLMVQSAGMLVCYQLCRMSRLNASPGGVFRKFCSGENSCRQVITSKGSAIAGISLVDIGSVYFVSMFTITLAALWNEHYYQWLPLMYWCAIIPLPYTLFSFYYQFRVQKKICVLCCAVQLLLWMQAAACFYALSNPFAHDIGAMTVYNTMFTALMAMGLYAAVSQLFRFQLRKEQLELSVYLLKTDPDVFHARLQRLESVSLAADIPASITLGDEESPCMLTVLLSLECHHCGEKLQEMLRLKKLVEGIGIRIIIRAAPASKNALHQFLQFAIARDNKTALSWLSTWYISRDNPSAACPDPAVQAAYAVHARWQSMFDVPYTPFIFYNGKPLPEMYYELNVLQSVLEKELEQTAIYEEQ